MTSAMGLMQQRQIDYTRSNESEADRVGIQTLSRAGYDAERHGRLLRAHAAGQSAATAAATERPDYLQTAIRSPPPASARPASAPSRSLEPASGSTSTPGGTQTERSRDPAAACPGLNPLQPDRCGAVAAAWATRTVRLGARAPARAQRRHPGAGDRANTSASPGTRQAAAPTPSATAWPWRRLRGDSPAEAEADTRRPLLRHIPGQPVAGAGAGRGRTARRQGRARPTSASTPCWRRTPDNRAGGA